MKKHCKLFRLFAFLICFGLVWPFESDVFAMQRRAKQTPQKKSAPNKRGGKSQSGRSGRPRRGGPSQAAGPRPAFDKIMSENRALLSESSDAELAAAQIEESKLRANVKYLADDLLEGRGPGSRGGMLAAKYIAAQFEALGLEPA